MKKAMLYKVLIVALAVVCLWQAAMIYLRYRDSQGRSVILSWKMSVSTKFMEAHHVDVREATDFSIRDLTEIINDSLGQQAKLEVSILPREEKRIEENILFSRNYNPTITFFYEEKDGIRSIVDFQANPSFLFAVSRHRLPSKEEWHFLRQMGYREIYHQNAKRMKEDLASCLTSSARPENSAFSEEEWQSLTSFAWGAYALTHFMYGLYEGSNCVEGTQAWRRKLKWCSGNVMAAYSEYYFQNEAFWVFLYLIRARILILLPLLGSLLLGFHLFRRNLYGLLREELDQQGVSLSRVQFWRLLWRNWKFIILPASELKMKNLIVPAIEEIKFRAEERSISKKARGVWQELEKTGVDPETLSGFRPSFELAKGRNNKKLATRQQHLMLLFRLLHKIEKGERRRPAGSVEAVPSKPRKKKAKTHDSTRGQLLEGVASLLPSDSQLDLGQLSRAELRNLETCLTFLPLVHPKATEVFLAQTNFGTLMQDRSRFFSAVKMGNNGIVLEALNLRRKRGKTPVQIGPRPAHPLRGKRVVLVGGGKIENIQQSFCEIIISLGAKECSFQSCGRLRRMEALVRSPSVDLILVFKEDTSHKAQWILTSRRKEGILFIKTTNPSSFKEEIQSYFS